MSLGDIVKRKRVSILCMVSIFILLCTACADNISYSESEEEITQENTVLNPQTEEEQNAGTVLEEQNEGAVLEEQNEGAVLIERTVRDAPVRIDFYTREQSTKNGDDAVLCTRKCIYPVVTIAGNENAADRINADIQKRIDSFDTGTSVLDDANQAYQSMRDSREAEFHFYPYFDELIFTAVRADSNVVSFLETSQYYIGGAHGMYYYSGLNYDTRTGERINFADLSANADAFRQDTLAFIHDLAATAAYQGIMWGNDADEQQEILYQDERWYLSTSGLVLFSNPYELGPFFAGEIEFTIPYSDLEGMDLKERYNYTGAKTIRLQTEEICCLDLNGDGREEEIQFYIDQMGSYDTDVHFIIDGTDYAVEHEELSRQFSDDHYIFSWAQCYLYDMDPTDVEIEIAFQMNYNTWEDDIVTPHTFLYRYERTGNLTYLGSIVGTITDPTVKLCMMSQSTESEVRN